MGEIRIFESAEALALVLADRVARSGAAAIAARGGFRLGLSGGRTPAGGYRALAAEERRAGLDWTRVTLLFADERGVPPEDPASNFRMVRETLLEPLGIAPGQVLRMRGEARDLEAAAAEYERHLVPPLDCLILGVGEDGHFASIFPGSAVVEERVRRVVAVLDAPKPPSRRLTLTPLAIAEAREVLVLATGAGKAAAVAAALAPAGDPHATPARLARAGAWLMDRAAASALPA